MISPWHRQQVPLKELWDFGFKINNNSMSSIFEAIQTFLKPLNERLDAVTEQHREMFLECSKLKLMGAPTLKLNNTQPHSVSRNRIKTLNSPTTQNIQQQVAPSLHQTLRKVTSPQPVKATTVSRPVTALVKNTTQRKPFAPLNKPKVQLAKSPKTTPLPPSRTPKKPVKPLQQTNHNLKPVKPNIKKEPSANRSPAPVTQLLQKSQAQKPIQIIECIEPILQLPFQEQKKVEVTPNEVQLTIGTPDIDKPQSLEQPLQRIIPQKQGPVKDPKIKKQQLVDPIKFDSGLQAFEPHAIQDIKLQNIHSAESVQEKTQKLIGQEKLKCSILPQQEDLFASFIERPPSNKNLTNNYLSEPTIQDSVL